VAGLGAGVGTGAGRIIPGEGEGATVGLEGSFVGGGVVVGLGTGLAGVGRQRETNWLCSVHVYPVLQHRGRVKPVPSHFCWCPRHAASAAIDDDDAGAWGGGLGEAFGCGAGKGCGT
jgi:hypothetical protein